MSLPRMVPVKLWHLAAIMVLFMVFGPNALGQRQCPTMRISENNFSNCNPDGTANVFLTVSFDNPNTDANDFAIAFLECAPDGTPAGNNTIGVSAGESDVGFTVTCVYPTPSTPQPFVRFTDINEVPFGDCPPLPVPFPPLAPCAGDCPTIASIIVDADPSTPTPDPLTCNFSDNGSWSIALDASINNKDKVTDGYFWNFGDGSSQVFIPANAPNAPRTTHTYQCPDTGDHFVTLTLLGCEGEEFYSNDETEVINFPSCGCPEIDNIATDVNGCEVTFDAAISGVCADAVTEYIWNFGDGNTETTLPGGAGDPTITSHTYDENGNYNVTLTLGGVGSGCSFSTVVGVTSCDGGGGGDGDNGNGCFFCFCGGLLCCLFWVLFILAVIAAITALANALCNPGNTAAWVLFALAVASVIALGGLLIAICDVDICALLLALAASGFAGFAVVCGTNIVPCESILCQKTSIPGTSVEVANLLIIDVIFTLVVLIICALL